VVAVRRWYGDGPDLGLAAPTATFPRRRGPQAVTQLNRDATSLSAVDVDLGEPGRDPHREQGQVGAGGREPPEVVPQRPCSKTLYPRCFAHALISAEHSRPRPLRAAAGRGPGAGVGGLAVSYSAMMAAGIRPWSEILYPRCLAHALISAERSRPRPLRAAAGRGPGGGVDGLAVRNSWPFCSGPAGSWLDSEE
jgi:hypothetical protein